MRITKLSIATNPRCVAYLKLPLFLLCTLAILAFSASPAFAGSPWFHITSGSRPGVLSTESGTIGEVILTAANLGDAPADGSTSAITIADHLPAGFNVLSISAVAGGIGPQSLGSVTCTKATLSCAFAGALPAYKQIEVRIKLETGEEGSQSGEPNRVTVSGGGAQSVSIARPLNVAEGPTPFGVEDYEFSNEEPGGAAASQAGSHPFQQTTTVVLNQAAAVVSHGFGGAKYAAYPVAPAKDLHFRWPPGLIGNPTVLPRCSKSQFVSDTIPGPSGELLNECPAQTAVGVANVTVEEPIILGLQTFSVPIFNLEPSPGEPASFGFYVSAAQTPVLIDPSIRAGSGGEGEADYGITVNVDNIVENAVVLSTQATIWGTPGDPRHDATRGWACLAESEGQHLNNPCEPSSEAHPTSFLTLPTSCSGASLQATGTIDSWVEPTNALPFSDPSQPTLDGCNELRFSPTIQAEPTTDRASAPTGLDFNLYFHDEGLTSAEGLAQSQLKNVSVVLPEGLTINPSAGVGLGGCSEADFARESVSSLPGEGCPNDSKLGTVEIETPLLSQKIKGSIFIAQPYENPSHSLVGLYVVAKNAEAGILIRLAGKVTPNPTTGRLTTTFENNPQLAFDHFNFHFREGQQAPLISPPACGTYSTEAQLTPWSEPDSSVTQTSSFMITKGYDGGACPSGGGVGGIPFHPQIQSGTQNNNAGTFSPFYLHLSRTDGEQEISGFSTNLPSGLTGDLSGIPFCPEANIALARTKTGGEEEANPSCPAQSQVGHTLVGTGVGAVLAYVPGKIYLAGPFHGAPFSLVAVTSAVVGPFDLGTVVLRFGLNIDPYTARVSVSPTTSEPIPTIIQGIVTHVRDIRVYIDRPSFTLNPTSCNPLAIGSTLNSNLGASATITSPFQAASCANLKFAPKFAVSTSGKTSRAKGASLAVKLTYPNAPQGTQANIHSVKVDLPKQLPSRLTTLQKACTAAQFNTNPANCPAASFIGHAKAITPLIPVPLEGPAIFVSHGGEAFPSLIMVLQGYGVTIDLVGSTFISKTGITSSTFKTVPDQPVGSFELTLPEGKYSALAANGNLCTSKLAMPTEFLAQNGAAIKGLSTPISVTGCAKAKALTRAQKLAAALKACNKKAKSKRAACRASARRQYGPVKTKKKSKG